MVVVDVVHILVNDMGLQHAPAPWNAPSEVGSAATSAAAIAATAVTTVASVSAAPAAPLGLSFSTCFALGVCFALSIGIDLGHHGAAVRGVSFVILDLEALRGGRASSGPVVANELAYLKTHLVLLIVIESGELLGEFGALELKADIGSQHHTFIVSSRGRGRCIGAPFARLVDVDCLGTKEGEARKSESCLHLLLVVDSSLVIDD
mmetsp:Transcript_10971/g.13856  ORF Transcript_10971/g.13856 Transcript_10971/m.13856 type:complete len:206 (+) Transcript_10971:139-756(+)